MRETIQHEAARVYSIDLERRPAQRLAAMVAAERHETQRLFTAAGEALAAVPDLLIDGFGQLYRDFDGPFQGELQVWAEAAGVSFGRVAALNCGYELGHLEDAATFGGVLEKILSSFLCTAGVREIPGRGLVHLRTLDWQIDALGPATRVLRYRRGTHEFVSVGFAGFVGVLSGMVPGAYSVTIDWAPPVGVPDFHHGPAFLLREVLTECRTYADAVDRLRRARLSTSVFFTVCGVAAGEACVIERTAEKAAVRPLEPGDVLAHSNHHVAAEFVANNAIIDTKLKNDPLLKTTRARREAMLEHLRQHGGAVDDLAALFSVFAGAPLTNEQTVQRMIFCPCSGELLLDRRLEIDGEDYTWGRSRWSAG